jgi:hypothetical protein
LKFISDDFAFVTWSAEPVTSYQHTCSVSSGHP